ncbi:MAG: MOSC domain-containing protein [Candidatus Methylacidiphilales bacterium]
MSRVYLARILLYPIKSLDPVDVQEAVITEGGTLRYDREWAIYDAKGKVFNAKRDARLHLIRALYQGDGGSYGAINAVRLSAPGQAETTMSLVDSQAIAGWLSSFLNEPVELRRDTLTGFPDDLEASGPTIVSCASLRAMTEWFPPLPEDPYAPGLGFGEGEARRRFRTNLELDGDGLPAFWEDRLFGNAGEEVAFRIGAVDFRGRNPCQRCAVPGRDSQTGELTPRFTKVFSDQRRATLPEWANKARFNHFYRFAVNTLVCPGQEGSVLRRGDELMISTHPSVISAA